MSEPEATPGQPDTPADPFGGHEFAYESHTDLFRCIRCHKYWVVVVNRETGVTELCDGQPPEGSGPIEVNAW